MDEEEPIIDDPVTDDAPKDVDENRKWRLRWLIVALVGAVLAGILLASSVWDNHWTSDGNAVGNDIVENKAGVDPQSLCAAQDTYDSIRRELFRRAAQVRGSDEQAYTRLSDFALLRMNGPVVQGVDDRLHSVTCGARAKLDLPPGVAAAGGRRSLDGDLVYRIQPAADGTGNVVRLGNADSIVVPLATLSRTGAPVTAPLIPPQLQNLPTLQDLQPQQPQIVTPEEGEEPQQTTTANPSFDCADASNRSEVAICNSGDLAALDRRMAGQFNAAMSQADRRQRRLLERTRDRFLSYRNRCATNQCIAETYRSRIREIDDIMSGDWRG